MKNNLFQKGCFLITILLSSFIANADVKINKISIRENNADVGYLTVTNKRVTTKFSYHVYLARTLMVNGSYEDATSTVSLVYTNCGICGAYTKVSEPRNVTNADFKDKWSGSATGFTDLIINAELPVGINYGNLMVEFKYYDSNQKKTLTLYMSSNYIPINYNPTPLHLDGAFTYPEYRSDNNPAYLLNHSVESYPMGIELPGLKTMTVTWNANRINSSDVYITFMGNGGGASTKKRIPNTGSYNFDFSGLNLQTSYNGSYSYFLIDEISDDKVFATSGVFRFIADHIGLFDSYYPSAFHNSNWIFRPDSSGSDDGNMFVYWCSNKIMASNVSIDLYNSDGTFYKKLTNSTPNVGKFLKQYDATIPLGNSVFYQYKITSIEDPSQFGYSEVFNHWLD
ncbi:hypothetical protein [Pedobacter sp. MR2016-24]|uniref:hypothetical protein n=1 Tax=Pedobacter sp. MR2016-24 TaxID=2994466 RepID=UPI0022454DC2|nr:hypothetical protein [Pedobacter sp. MR2016-24]MCX2482581.1 hypothetical protein [Pedobacter sp. MR2016-24]